MAKAIMIQGTMSNAGKSLLAAGLCRIFRQDGYRVAPFKSQNMALNSCITPDGLEMGRAQVMQAEACGIPPEVDMNPILLKPTSDVGSQVIVAGKPIGNMPAMQYYRRKRELIPVIQQAYDRLASRFDIIVLEGAGSPAEINLKQNDIVNMGMARMAKAPVLLAGDIDRGGVFAALAGTLMLLESQERDMVKGLIINKFRGDRAILQPGVEMIEDITKKSVVGVVPYLSVDIDDEDSLSQRLCHSSREGMLDVAVIHVPHISNFTDFSPLEQFEQISVRYVGRAAGLGNPDLVILPGTKNTMTDLCWLRESGLEACILRHAHKGGLVLGVCGGYQMLGDEISDPVGAEHGGQMRGMGLLPVRTVFSEEKARVRTTGQVQALEGEFSPLSGAKLEGYEIHMGRTEGAGCGNFCVLGDVQRPDGMVRGNVLGTYVHGLFDSASMAQAMAKLLLQRRGLEGHVQAEERDAYKQRQYDQLAQGIRAHVDMEQIYRILEQGI